MCKVALWEGNHALYRCLTCDRHKFPIILQYVFWEKNDIIKAQDAMHFPIEVFLLSLEESSKGQLNIRHRLLVS